MTSSISASTLDPATTAQQLATAYTQQTQSLLDTQTQAAQATTTGLTQLKSALDTFSSALAGLSTKKSLSQLGASFSNSAIGTATASAGALPGSYQMYVQQLATKNQVAFQDLPAIPVSAGGSLGVSLANGTNFNVDLSSADTDGDGTLSQTEIARAINQASGNGGSLTAMVVSSGGTTQLMLSSGVSGAGGAISLDASSLPASGLKTALSAAPNQLVAAQDAIVWMGAKDTGVKIQQGSNTLNVIDGVSINLTQAQGPSDAPVTFTVAKDDSGTQANVQKFVDAFNALQKTLNTLTANADPKNNTAAAAFASDSGVQSLKDRLASMVRNTYGGQSLRTLGISIDRDGVMTLDATKLNATLATKPAALDDFFGSTGSSVTAGTGSALFGDLSKLADQWTNSASGQIKQRQDSVQTMQKSISDRQTRLDDQYNAAYARYLTQFTALQQLQSQLDQTTSMLAALGTS
ncbi:flagellar filament capping protein FliD [Paucibacter sp. R3-3]|uniref:Flagellar hook-associated protein 2 n=1 Tax=Roseateles agri TaxID=3098619 RepID=A0ABU5DP42_9BURK|nr:flagellar filament capping protein FliD [Paucibacter sp. R3-3]MDY0747435.1 flagellar filament capping protein FliD [Paucibacter sp. R3-3]